MTARRQPSTTSLSRFARASSPGLQNRSLDFCNAFWGIADGGVEVLFARMRGATRTIDELKNYWKERAAIEEDYAKRLSKLAKQTLGRDEIGELRNSLDTLKLETDNQANFHIELTRQIRTLLEGPTSAFYAKQQQHKKVFQTAIEKDYKAKQTQESYVTRAREKYEADCLRINSFTAQSTLVQGKDLEKIHIKLERAQQTVQANERDFANFAKALGVTVAKWEQDWKAFCDSCQDMEEDRLNFMKDTMWAYANAVSTVCVADDESCEKMRLALEQTEPEQDMENFVRDYGTGNLIPDPPAFVNYTTPDAVPSSSSRPTTHPAQFVRMTNRQATRNVATPEEEEPAVNTAGVGAGGRRGDPQPDAPLHRSQTRGSTRSGSVPPQAQQPQTNGGGSLNGHQTSGSQQITRRPTSSGQPMNYRPPQDPHAETIDPTAETFIKVGGNVYKADPSKDPQQQGGPGSRMSPMPMQAGGAIDPFVQHMEDLKRAASTAGSSQWSKPSSQQQERNKPSSQQQQDPRAGGSTVRKGTLDSAAGPSLALPSSSTSKTIPGGSSQQAPRDYRNSAEIVVGAHPSVSRPSSPNPPTAKFMVPRTPSPSNAMEQRVISDYQQSMPGEGKSPSRSNSRQGSYSGPPPPHQPSHAHTLSQGGGQGQGQNLARPTSQMGHVGIGAHGRSTSPQPISRSASPVGGLSYMGPPPGGPGVGGGGGVMRATSPGLVMGGEVVDAYGRVLQQQGQQGYQQTGRQGYPAQGGNPGASMQGPAPGYGGYQAPPPPASQVGYMAPQYTQAQGYAGAPPPQQQQQVYQPQPAYGGGQAMHPQQTQQQQQQQQLAMQQQQQVPQQQQLTYPAQTAVTRTPSPQPPPPMTLTNGPPPTGQTTEDGRGILFYVKALYDYNATIEEEFDFQAGDIIAVTATPEDGWWSGELLDEARRQPGRHVFPSNFVCLF